MQQNWSPSGAISQKWEPLQVQGLFKPAHPLQVMRTGTLARTLLPCLLHHFLKPLLGLHLGSCTLVSSVASALIGSLFLSSTIARTWVGRAWKGHHRCTGSQPWGAPLAFGAMHAWSAGAASAGSHSWSSTARVMQANGATSAGTVGAVLIGSFSWSFIGRSISQRVHEQLEKAVSPWKPPARNAALQASPLAKRRALGHPK